MLRGISNAWNPSNNKYYCEWWYFILFDEKLGAVSGCLSITGDCTNNPRGHLWMNIYTGPKREYLVIPDRDVIASSSKVDMRLGKNRFYEEDGKLLIKIDEGLLKIDVTAKKTVNLEDNYSRVISGGSEIDWLVPMVRGEYSGTITLKGKKSESKGLIFHDHVRLNFKNASDFKKLKSLSWGVSFEKNKGFVFADIDTGERLKTVIVQEGKRVKKINIKEEDMENTMALFPDSFRAVCKGKIYKMDYSASELNKSAKNFFVQTMVDTKDCVSYKGGKDFCFEYVELFRAKRSGGLPVFFFFEDIFSRLSRKKKR